MFPSAYVPQTCSPVPKFPELVHQSLCSPVLFQRSVFHSLCSPNMFASLCSPINSPVRMFPNSIPQKCFPFPMFPKHVPQSLCSPVPMFPKHVPQSMCAPNQFTKLSVYTTFETVESASSPVHMFPEQSSLSFGIYRVTLEKLKS